ncbi:hypothetical protein [Bradyrhizobium sp. USDA 3315]
MISRLWQAAGGKQRTPLVTANTITPLQKLRQAADQRETAADHRARRDLSEGQGSVRQYLTPEAGKQYFATAPVLAKRVGDQLFVRCGNIDIALQ